MRRDDLRSRGYTERHPDIRKLTEQIAQKEKSLADLKASATPDVEGRDTSATIQDQKKLKANQNEISNLEHEVAALKAKISEYQGRLNEEPALEQQFAELTRGYDLLKAQYDDLLNKKGASEMVTNRLSSHQGEQAKLTCFSIKRSRWVSGT